MHFRPDTEYLCQNFSYVHLGQDIRVQNLLRYLKDLQLAGKVTGNRDYYSEIFTEKQIWHNLASSRNAGLGQMKKLLYREYLNI